MMLPVSRTVELPSSLRTRVEPAGLRSSMSTSSMAQLRGSISRMRADTSPTTWKATPAINPEALMAGVAFHVVGDVSARILLMLPRNCAMELVDMLLRNPAGSTRVLNELGNSTVRETGNIMASAYLNALSDFLAMLLLPSVPNLVFDIAGAILDASADGVERKDGQVYV